MDGRERPDFRHIVLKNRTRFRNELNIPRNCNEGMEWMAESDAHRL